MTPEEIRQAVARVRAQFDRLPDSDAVLVPKADLAALLALTEQVEKLDDEALKWTMIAGEHAEQVDALTGQQPEPVKRYRIDGPYSNGFELVDTADTVLGTYASRRMVEVECDMLERKHREQSERDADV